MPESDDDTPRARAEAQDTGPEPARLAPLYPRWATAVFRLLFVTPAVALVAVPTFFIAWARTAYSTGASAPQLQPVNFDHRHHVRDDGIDCQYCHHAVDRSAYAGVPSTDVCMNCHSQIWNDTPGLSRVRASYFGGEPIVWERVFTLPQFVFFNHAVHVNRNVGCVSCHGRVDLMGQVYMPVAMTMSWCIDCHRHPENHLRPADRITDMEWAPGRPQRELGLEIRAKRGISPPTHCSGCHR